MQWIDVSCESILLHCRALGMKCGDGPNRFATSLFVFGFGDRFDLMWYFSKCPPSRQSSESIETVFFWLFSGNTYLFYRKVSLR